MNKPMMKCGCIAQGVCSQSGGVKHDPPIPVCVIHDCTEQAEMPDLTGRQAKCAYGHRIVDSSPNLAFFKHQPDQEYDEYYCGCHGWD